MTLWGKLSIILVILALSVYPFKYFMNGPVCESNARLDGNVAIVTGGNAGIGKETVIDFLNRGARVIVGCRSLERCDHAATEILNVTGVPANRLVTSILDLSSFASIRRFAQHFKYNETRLDILVNNAGVFQPYRYSKTDDGYEMTFAINHLGPFLLTNLLTDILIESAPSRVVTVSSAAHLYIRNGFKFDIPFVEEQDYYSLVSYAYSKLGNILFSREIGRRLNGTGVTTYSLHPGTVQTNIARTVMLMEYKVTQWLTFFAFWPFLKDAYHGAQTQVCCAVDPALADHTGRYYKDVRESEPSVAAQKDEDAVRLWDMSIEMSKLREDELHPRLRSSKHGNNES